MEEKLMEFMVGLQQQFTLLAQEQREGFRQVHLRLDKVEQRLDQMDARLDQMDHRFDQMDARLDQMDCRFDQVDAQLKQMDDKLDVTFNQVAASAEDVTELHTVVSFRFEAHRNIMARTEEDVELLKVKFQNN